MNCVCENCRIISASGSGSGNMDDFGDSKFSNNGRDSSPIFIAAETANDIPRIGGSISISGDTRQAQAADLAGEPGL
ncbi:hypothetical protein BDBG_05651 [Blastomyces gilchristii SLH14081]|uniref:Uncharacterized protein n=1 Tax=Blastomyces gilchristii (strain SLH14081) TaxID=559298 RepID=A0A179UPN2_BLAGS|nr:uncharacterized protein BDBG_05651 [Blastomyces gilchristii SLH14081]OAT09964.1 hypothetical protein BDBG_05651 [Blastomyces gilchristii SLH14081]